jgi:hypothetical protein
MQLPTTVQAVVDTYLEAVDAEAPALVEGLYLFGSVALGEFRPNRSDIDFAAVTSSPIGPSSLSALERAHARLSARWPRPYFDGIYVTWDDLANDPASAAPGPHVHEHQPHREGRSERHVVTWHTLAQCGARCRGPAVADLRIWSDAAALAAWTNDNLESYWSGMLKPGTWLTRRGGVAGLTAYACEWCVLGVSRLHYTLATGKITSKAGAGVYALGAFPTQWRRVIEESLRIRRGETGRSLYRSPFSRRRDLLAFTEMAIADAHRLYERYASGQSITTDTSSPSTRTS